MHTLALLLLIAQAAPVVPPPIASPPPAAKMRAQGLLTEGSRLYGEGDYAGALEKFNAAYQAYPSPKLLFNIGQANRDLSRPVEARDAFERYLASEDDPSSPTIPEAQQSLDELQRKLGRLRVECDKDGAEVRLDGKSWGTTPIAKVVWATPGRHQLTANHASATPTLEDVDIRAGVLSVVTLRLAPPSTPLPADVQAVATSPEPVPAREGRHWRWAWVAAGSTAALGIGAIVAGLSMQSKYDSLNSSCGSASVSGKGCDSSAIDSVTLRRDMANVLWGLAGAAAVTTGILFYVEGRPVTLAPVAGPMTGAVARATF